MIRCTKCVIPDSRPDTEFVDGVCSACLAYKEWYQVDLTARYNQLLDLLERNKGGEYDCIVASSGGKDSTYIVLKLLELGVRPLVVTATTCHLTDIGRRNIDNLSRYATTWECTPDRRIRALLNKIGLETVGDISWPEHISIFTTPFKIAALTGIKLIFFGECPQNAYGGPRASQDASQLTRRWRSEYGGFLGLRPTDLIGQYGITEADMQDYILPPMEQIEGQGIEAHFLGHYLPWDSHYNARQALEAGMIQVLPCESNWWVGENLDNAQTGIHDHMMYRKYGYGRCAAQVSVDIRQGILCREKGMEIVKERDGLFPFVYMDVGCEDMLERINMTWTGLRDCLNQFTDWGIFMRDEVDYRPRFAEENNEQKEIHQPT